MKLFPRHLKVLAAANGFSDINYISQRSGVASVCEVAQDLLRAGLLSVTKRNVRSKNGHHKKWKGRYQRTLKGDAIVGKDVW